MDRNEGRFIYLSKCPSFIIADTLNIKANQFAGNEMESKLKID